MTRNWEVTQLKRRANTSTEHGSEQLSVLSWSFFERAEKLYYNEIQKIKKAY